MPSIVTVFRGLFQCSRVSLYFMSDLDFQKMVATIHYSYIS